MHYAHDMSMLQSLEQLSHVIPDIGITETRGQYWEVSSVHELNGDAVIDKLRGCPQSCQRADIGEDVLVAVDDLQNLDLAFHGIISA